MMRLSCIPAVIDCILIYYFLDESSRFLLLTRNYDQAFNVIDKMITMNNSQEKEVLDDNDKVRLVEWKEKYFLERRFFVLKKKKIVLKKEKTILTIENLK